MNSLKEIFILIFFILIGISSRLIEHLPNFTPIVGIALFVSYRWNPKYSIVFVLITMLISDLIIGYDSIPMRILVYSSLAIPSILGFFIRNSKTRKSKYLYIFGFSLSSSIFFYLITNFGVWLWSGMYEHTFEGLVVCYTMAIPFFKNSLMGDIFSSFLIFGISDVIHLYSLLKLKNIEHISVVK